MSGEESRGVSRSTLKYLAAFAMLLDHIAHLFLPELSPLYFCFRFIGRLTAPIMCFFLAEGYYYTRSKSGYQLRLMLFALLSQFPYIFAFSHGKKWTDIGFSMIFTLLCSFLLLLTYDTVKSFRTKIALTALLLFASSLSDWSVIAPFWVLFFWKYRGDMRKKITAFCIVAAAFPVMDMVFLIANGYPWYRELWQFGVFTAVPLLISYHGAKGKSGMFHKWFFYVFYPLHLLVLGFISRIFG